MIGRTNVTSKKGGFLLVEIVVTIGLIGIVVIMHYVMVQSTVLAQNVKHKDLALKIASHKIEELRALGYDGVPVSGSFPDSLLASLPGGTGAMAITDYNAGVKQVAVTVSWTHSGAARSVSLNTLLTNTGGL